MWLGCMLLPVLQLLFVTQPRALLQALLLWLLSGALHGGCIGALLRLVVLHALLCS
jgi:hypothetical protein